MAMSGDGLFSKARDAAEKYKKAQKDEQGLISEIGKGMNGEYIGAYVEGYEPTGVKCTITGEQSGLKNNLNEQPFSGVEKDGSQTFTTAKESELKWRIWDYDGTTLRLISDKLTTQSLRLAGAIGYNNGVWVMNEICRQCFGRYKDGEMEKGINVSNWKRSDIEKVSTYDYTKFKDSNENFWWHEKNLITKGNYYGERRNYDGTFKVPVIWNLYDSNWNSLDDRWKIFGKSSCEDPWELELEQNGNNEEISKSGSIEFKQSSWCFDYKGKRNLFDKTEYYDMIFSESITDPTARGAFLATRTCELLDDFVRFRSLPFRFVRRLFLNYAICYF